jgi:hypothetical protein
MFNIQYSMALCWLAMPDHAAESPTPYGPAAKGSRETAFRQRSNRINKVLLTGTYPRVFAVDLPARVGKPAEKTCFGADYQPIGELTRKIRASIPK